MTRIMPLSEAKAHLSELVASLQKTEGEYLITRNGRPAAVLLSPEEFESWQETKEIQKNPQFMRDIRKGLRQLKEGEHYTFEEVFGESPKRRRRK